MKYSGALMNNVKWNYLFEKATEFDIYGEVAFVSEENHWYERAFPVEVELIDKTGLKDPGIGGPCYYKNIYKARLRKWKEIRDPISGRRSLDEADSKEFVLSLKNNGQYPISEDNDWIYINGYHT